ncbi:MAG: RNA 2',3'-cyclic phosphodiesterase [Methylocystaceae bacterium]|nr:RNA 2',3'-cyclic phosphodiesterase [Methylocystaceae bacterium]
MLRLFIGLELPGTVLDRLEQLCSGLKEARWVEPHNMHLTLFFIGEIDEGQAEDLHHGLDKIRFDPFDLYLAELNCFAHKHQPSSIWAGVKGDVVALHHLQNKVRGAVEIAGIEAEKRKYKPHVTIARLKKTPSEQALSYMEAHNVLKTEAFTVSRFTLFRSHLTRHGAEYEVLERYGLRK